MGKDSDWGKFGVKEQICMVQWYLVNLGDSLGFDRVAFRAWVAQFGEKGNEGAEINLRCVILGSVMGVFPKENDRLVSFNWEEAERLMRAESGVESEEPGFYCFSTWEKEEGLDQAGKNGFKLIITMKESCDCHGAFDAKMMPKLASEKMDLLEQMGFEVEI